MDAASSDNKVIILEESQIVRRYRYGRRRRQVKTGLLVVAALILAAIVAWGQPVKELAPQATPSLVRSSPAPEWIAVHYRCQKIEDQTFAFVPVECDPAITKGCDVITLSCVNCSCPTEEK